MNISLPLSADVENILIRRAAAAGKELSVFVAGVVTEAVVEELEPAPPTESAVRRAARFRERLESWTALHPVLDHVIDDSRESIYAGRGE